MSESDSLFRPGRGIAVLSGGHSAERDVSLKSGMAVARALRARGRTVVEIDPARNDLAGIDWTRIPAGRPSVGEHLAIECVFIALHGAFGEDGGVQGLLESQGVPYTGSGPAASALAFSKWDARQRFLASGIPTAPAVRIRASDPAGFAHTAANSIGYPLVVKPDRQGSSIGVAMVPSRAHLEAALKEAFRFDSTILLETALPGDEWTVAVIDGRPLPPLRICTGRAFYDYTAKYAAEDTQYLFEDTGRPGGPPIAEIGVAACQSLGCEGIARVDLRCDAEGKPYVLEVNTVPGMTDHSLVPKAAAKIGLSMSALCEHAIVSAVALHHARKSSHVLPGPAPTLLHRRAG